MNSLHKYTENLLYSKRNPGCYITWNYNPCIDRWFVKASISKSDLDEAISSLNVSYGDFREAFRHVVYWIATRGYVSIITHRNIPSLLGYGWPCLEQKYESLCQFSIYKDGHGSISCVGEYLKASRSYGGVKMIIKK